MQSRLGLTGLFVLALAGCSSEDAEPVATGREPVVFSMKTRLEAGTEAEHCKFVRAPAEGMIVNDDVITYTAGSHHFLLYETPYEEFPTQTNQGVDIVYVDEETGVFDCGAGVTFDYSVTNLIGGSQNANGDSVVDFPEGVGMRVKPNAVLLMNAHYINTTGAVLEPEAEVAIHTIDEADLQEEGGVLFWYNMFIKVPAMSTAHTTMRCEVPDDITVTNTQSHMHARGVDYAAEVLDGDGRLMMYENTAWQNVPVKRHDPALAIAGGSTVEFTCHYDNPEARDIYQGPRSTDEMCMLIASYYPAQPHVSLCSGKEEFPVETNFMGGEWIGQGEATCAESLSCFQGAIGAPGGVFGILSQVGECVIASDPAVSPELSAAIGCTFSEFMTGGDPFGGCGEPFAACSAR